MMIVFFFFCFFVFWPKVKCIFVQWEQRLSPYFKGQHYFIWSGGCSLT